MYSLLFIAANNIKKKKSNSVILLCLVSLSVLLLYVSISILTNSGKVMDMAYEKAHSADYYFMSSSDKTEKLTALMKEQPEVEEFETEECLYILDARYHKESGKEKTYQFIFGSIDTERRIGKLQQESENSLTESKISDNSILLPYYLKADGSFKEGDILFLSLRGIEYKFIVSGFVEDPLFATPLNISVYKCYITEKCMQAILSREPELNNNVNQEYKVRLKKGESSSVFEKKMSELISTEIPDLEGQTNLELNYEVMREGNMVLSDIVMEVMLVFSILLIFIGLIIIRFSVRSFVEENMKNIGILKSSGYTGKQLQRASILEIMGITFIGVAIGLLLGAVCSSPIGNLEASIIGLRWSQIFDYRAAVISCGLVLILVLAATASVRRIYRKVTVLDALRGGIHTHNFKKNYFSFETGGLPESMTLGLKSIMGEKIKSLSILCIIILLSFTSCVGFSLYQNFSRDYTNVLKIAGLELGTAVVTGGNLEQIQERVEAWEEILFTNLNETVNVKIINGDRKISLSCDVWEKPERLKNELMVKGRMLKNDNEIVLTTKAAKRIGADVGDVVYVECKGERKEYIISGIDQKIQHLGIRGILSVEGAKRLDVWNPNSFLYLYAGENVSYNKLEKRLKEEFNEISIMDSQKQAETAISSVSMGMKWICIVFVIITILVVIMIVMLLIWSKIIKERKNYGIYKAIGYTTRQLILQTMMSNLPIMLIGSIIGSFISIYMTNPLVTLCLSMFGIQKIEMVIYPRYLIITIAGIVITAALVSWICSSRIRRIEPVKMLVEE